MKKTAFLYTLLMLSTLMYMPFQYPIPKIGGHWDAGYHFITQINKETGYWHFGRPKIHVQDIGLVAQGLASLGLQNLSNAEAPLKYDVNYQRLFSEWFFITFIFLIWMLAFRFSRPNPTH